MAWPTKNAWNQHLEETNRRPLSRQYSISLVMVEAPYPPGLLHTEHVHPYWQMQLVEKKGFSVLLNTGRLTPEDGDILLIPPQNWHYIDYPNGMQAWSIKFVVAEMEEKYPGGILSKSRESEILHKALLEAVSHESTWQSPQGQILVEHLLGIALDLHFREHGWDETEDIRIKKIRQRIEELLVDGKTVAVNKLAKENDCSTVYLNRIFKKHLGIPLKVYIDQCRFEMARHLLAESKLNITEIGSEMGFDDVFRFSRFFKRMSGKSPRQFRTDVRS
jgi:AraC family transcriptional activator of pobA